MKRINDHRQLFNAARHATRILDRAWKNGRSSAVKDRIKWKAVFLSAAYRVEQGLSEGYRDHMAMEDLETAMSHLA